MKKMWSRYGKYFLLVVLFCGASIFLYGTRIKAETYDEFLARNNRTITGTSYYETINGIKWEIVVDTEGNGAIKPTSKEDLIGEVVIPETVAGHKVTDIGIHAFDSCQKITGITIPSGVIAIHRYAFTQSFKLLNINVVPDNPIFCSVDGVLYTKEKDTIVTFPNGRTESYKIPEYVKCIGRAAFDDALLSELWIPESVSRICGFAFATCNTNSIYGYCQPLKKVYYEGSYQKLNELAPIHEIEEDVLNEKKTDLEETYLSLVENIYCMAPSILGTSTDKEYKEDMREKMEPVSISLYQKEDYPANVSFIGSEPVYQWYKSSTSSNENGTLIEGATNSTFTPIMENNTTFYYYCTATSTYMDNAYMSISEPVKIQIAIPENKITYCNQDGAEIEQEMIAHGSILKRPEDPELKGYQLEGWYTDEALTEPYDFTTPIENDITLYAKWKLDYAELEDVVEDAKIKINSGLYQNDIKFKLYKAAVKRGEILLKEQDATSPDEILEVIAKIKNAETKITLISGN